ncbi:MAG: hypothetical protein M1837_002239 [Sclerophora amabilis]|nr:MAG: hypothetical protein M1837_002239 [Sclerophora amabilis]
MGSLARFISFEPPFPAAPSLGKRATRIPKHLELLRAILRECRRLPDPAARSHCAERALKQYRKHRGSNPDQGELKSRVKKASKSLRFLRRANEGERGPLLKVLLHTYGRAGPRRRDLLAQLQGPDVPANQTMVEALASLKPRNPREDLRDWPHISLRLKALTISQKDRAPPGLTRPKIKRISPNIPSENVWSRPFPKVRERNLRRKFYGDLLNRVLPPLPPSEWCRLRDLASGIIREPRVAWARRGEVSETAQLASVYPTGYQTELLSRGVMAPETIPHRRVGRQHQITTRFMKRLWAEVFSQCPVMRWDGSTNRWKVRWGRVGDSSNIIRQPNEEEERLLDCENDCGRRTGIA